MTEAAPPRGWPEIVLSGLWTEFRGLPVAIREQELLDGLGRLHSVSHRRASTLSGKPVTLVEADLLRYWLDDDALVLIAEMHDPPNGFAIDALLEAMGPAERESGGRYRRYGAITTEFVYLPRGLVLTVAESYDEPPKFEPFLAAAHLFAPTDMEDFAGRLGGEDHIGTQLPGAPPVLTDP
jgi:hypothetical protein